MLSCLCIYHLRDISHLREVFTEYWYHDRNYRKLVRQCSPKNPFMGNLQPSRIWALVWRKGRLKEEEEKRMGEERPISLRICAAFLSYWATSFLFEQRTFHKEELFCERISQWEKKSLFCWVQDRFGCLTKSFFIIASFNNHEEKVD